MNRKYWTIQASEALDYARETGFLRGNSNYIDPDMIEAYHFMMSKMKDTISCYQGGYPIWMWTNRSDALISMQSYVTPGQRNVLLEVMIDENFVLLSDFISWHHVLNRWSLDNNHEVDMFKSWERIFDVNVSKLAHNMGELVVQAVTEEIDIKHIQVEIIV